MTWKISCLPLAIALSSCSTLPDPRTQANFASLPKIAQVGPRYQSYNVEMVEVTGGQFWAPYSDKSGETYKMRGPIDLADTRLRNLAKHLAPALMRVSGTWANTTYLPDKDEEISAVPEGYRQILTRDQWRGVVDFSNAVDAPIVTSFAVGVGTRGPNGEWQTEQAQRLADLNEEAGGTIAAVEFINEPNAALMGGLPAGYGTDDYIRDFGIFQDWARRALPETLIAGPGGVGESMLEAGIPVALQGRDLLLTKDVMPRISGLLDIVSYHSYPTVSQRCSNTSREPARIEDALTPEWLDATLQDYAYYSPLRDLYEPNKPIWITETAQAACGGSPWAASFLDSFRYVNQLGLLAQKNVDVVFHNTLAASDYALIDEDTLEPRPSYWAAVLWNRLMGTNVLASPPSPSSELRLYAHCLKSQSGGVAVAAINIGETALPMEQMTGATAWVMTAKPLTSVKVSVNGRQPEIGIDGQVTGLDGESVSVGHQIPAQSIAFYAIPTAGNSACQ